jgi:glycosyltransferase involved in cell wall biosynthesis
MTAPDVSVVFETENESDGHGIRLSDVLLAWKRQSRRDRVLEWIVVAPRSPSEEEAGLLEGEPARWILRPDLRYYAQKNLGISESRGEWIALADSDAEPETDWLARALDALEAGGPSTALVTGKSTYRRGPFSRELALCQLPNQDLAAGDTTHFLAHNVLMRRGAVAPLLFSGGHIRLGSDTHLADRLKAGGWTLRYEPAARVTHNYGRLSEMYLHCVVIGYSNAKFEAHVGERPRPAWLDAIGRFRVLAGRLRRLRRAVGIPLARVPISLAFLAAYSLMVGVGYRRFHRGLPEPFAAF